LDSDTACSKGGKHKLVEDHESGEEICTKCGITIKMDPAGYRDPHGKPKESSQGPVTSKGSLGANVSGKEFQAPAGSRGKYLRHHGHDPFSEPEVKRAELQVENATWNKGQKNRALDLFQTTRKKLKGKNFETFVDACCYIACREQGVPMHKALNLGDGVQQKRKKTKLVKYYREICNYLNIGLPPFKAINSLKWVGERVEYSMYSYENDQPYEETLKLPPDVIREATKLLSKIPDSETGSNPIGIAASILYIVSVTSGHPFTQKQFAEAAEVNPQTVSNNTKRLNSIIKKNKLGKYVDHNTRYHRIV
jgi:transcription initiation factor TFIIIB Brf1 subunit/transcription initiation factor TFIIB